MCDHKTLALRRILVHASTLAGADHIVELAQAGLAESAPAVPEGVDTATPNIDRDAFWVLVSKCGAAIAGADYLQKSEALVAYCNGLLAQQREAGRRETLDELNEMRTRYAESDLKLALATQQPVAPAHIMPEAAWNDYATLSGLLNEHGVAPDRAKTQTAYFAYQAAWNSCHAAFSAHNARSQPVAPELTDGTWQVFTDATQFKEMRPFDIVLKNGVTLYNQHYNTVDWTAVCDWRYVAYSSAPPKAEPKLVLSLPDHETRSIEIASDEVIDGERVVCVGISPKVAVAEPLQSEVEQLRREQAATVMPLIGPLLDAFEGAQRCDLEEVSTDLVRYLKAINSGMEGGKVEQVSDDKRDAERYRKVKTMGARQLMLWRGAFGFSDAAVDELATPPQPITGEKK